MRQHTPLFLLVSCVAALAAPAPVTFHKDVEPLLQQHCQSCHRAGEITLMPLLTCHEIHKGAASVEESVARKKMPPWYADFGCQQTYEFGKDRTIPAGTRLDLTALNDNYPNNPDAAATVTWGEQTYEVMTRNFIDIQTGPKTEVEGLFARLQR